MTLYDDLPCSVVYDDMEYSLDLSYTAVLAAFDALEDNDLPARAQIETALDLLVLDEHPCDIGLLKAVFGVISPERRSATGSLRGARPTMETVVPGIRPMSRMRRPISPRASTVAILPLWPICI